MSAPIWHQRAGKSYTAVCGADLEAPNALSTGDLKSMRKEGRRACVACLQVPMPFEVAERPKHRFYERERIGGLFADVHVWEGEIVAIWVNGEDR
jgi:hypothetical protein